MESFKDNPTQLLGKSFLQEGDFYEVVEMGMSEESIWYQIQFEGCVDYMQMSQDEVLKMVNDGSIMCIIYGTLSFFF